MYEQLMKTKYFYLKMKYSYFAFCKVCATYTFQLEHSRHNEHPTDGTSFPGPHEANIHVVKTKTESEIVCPRVLSCFPFYAVFVFFLISGKHT